MLGFGPARARRHRARMRHACDFGLKRNIQLDLIFFIKLGFEFGQDLFEKKNQPFLSLQNHTKPFPFIFALLSQDR